MDLSQKMFIGLLSICTKGTFGESLVSILKGPIKCVSLNNHACQARPTLVNINSDKTIFYPLTVSMVDVVTLMMIHMYKIVFQMK